MDIKLLKNAILQNNIPPLMFFIGNEQYLMHHYLDGVSNTLNKCIKWYDSADEVLYETSTNFKDDFVYVICNDDKIIKNPAYKNALQNTKRNIIVYYTEFDTKCELYKNSKELFVNFERLDRYTILAYLCSILKVNKITVDNERLLKLVDMCECDLGKAVNELDKIVVLNQASSNMVFDYMLSEGFSDYEKVDVYKFVNKVINRDRTAYVDMVKLDESVVGVLTLIYNQARHRFSATRDVRYVDMMMCINMLDCGIKDGTVSANSALQYLLLKCM